MKRIKHDATLIYSAPEIVQRGLNWSWGKSGKTAMQRKFLSRKQFLQNEGCTLRTGLTVYKPFDVTLISIIVDLISNLYSSIRSMRKET